MGNMVIMQGPTALDVRGAYRRLMDMVALATRAFIDGTDQPKNKIVGPADSWMDIEGLLVSPKKVQDAIATALP